MKINEIINYALNILIVVGLIYLTFFKSSCNSDSISKKDFQEYIVLENQKAELEIKNAKLEVIDSIKNLFIDDMMKKVSVTKENINTIKTNLQNNLNTIHNLSLTEKENLFSKLYGFGGNK
jgi:hypothetical protein